MSRRKFTFVRICFAAFAGGAGQAVNPDTRRDGRSYTYLGSYDPRILNTPTYVKVRVLGEALDPTLESGLLQLLLTLCCHLTLAMTHVEGFHYL